MPKFFKNPFATGGDKVAVPDNAQLDNTVSYDTGYTPEYELNQDTDPNALDVEREKQNQVFFDVTDNIRQWQTFGVFPFITAAQNGGVAFPYSKFSKMVWTDGIVYESSVEANTTNPDTNPENWNQASDFARSIINWAGLVKFSGDLAFASSSDASACSMGSGDSNSFQIITVTAGLNLQQYRLVPSTTPQTWVAYGAPSPWSGGGSSTITAMSKTEVVGVSEGGEELVFYRHNGTILAPVGAPFPLSGIQDPVVVALSGTDVALIDTDTDTLRRFHFDGASFSPVGNSLAISVGAFAGFAALSENSVAVGSEFIRKYDFDGTDWTEQPGTLSGLPGGLHDMEALNERDVAIFNSLNVDPFDAVTIYRYDKGWAKVAGPFFMNLGVGFFIAKMNGTDFAIHNGTSLSASRLSFSVGHKSISSSLTES